MINDNYQSTLAAGTPYGAGIVSWGDYAIGDYIDTYTVQVKERVFVAPESNDFRLWRDMAEEPWKYGDDIGDWLDLDAELRAGPGRWRVDAYWTKEQQAVDWANLEAKLWNAWNEFLARKEMSVVRIQALVRGHLVRNRIPWRDCCMCLAHHISPVKTDVGFMCRQCSHDGPFTDLIGMDDPWEWHRAEK